MKTAKKTAKRSTAKKTTKIDSLSKAIAKNAKTSIAKKSAPKSAPTKTAKTTIAKSAPTKQSASDFKTAMISEMRLNAIKEGVQFKYGSTPMRSLIQVCSPLFNNAHYFTVNECVNELCDLLKKDRPTVIRHFTSNAGSFPDGAIIRNFYNIACSSMGKYNGRPTGIYGTKETPHKFSGKSVDIIEYSDSIVAVDKGALMIPQALKDNKKFRKELSSVSREIRLNAAQILWDSMKK